MWEQATASVDPAADGRGQDTAAEGSDDAVYNPYDLIAVPQQDANKQQHFIVSYNGVIHLRWVIGGCYSQLAASILPLCMYKHWVCQLQVLALHAAAVLLVKTCASCSDHSMHHVRVATGCQKAQPLQ